MEGSRAARMVRVFLLAGIGYLFFVFHGLSSHLTPWSQALINAVVKYAYPTTGQEDATVLLFREENLADLKTQYPVPYRLHAEIIEALASYAPRAVFVDFAFIDNRDPEALRELARSLCTLREAGSEVYTAAPIGDDRRPTVAPELLACARPAMPERDGKTGESGILTYFAGRAGADGFVSSPAFALAASRTGIAPEKADKLEIIWGKGTAPLNRRWMDCREKHGSELLAKVLFDSPLADRLDCPYHRTLTVNHLLNSVGDADIEDALKGRTVFYGAGFRFTGDTVESPVYGEMPGVYLHAMAYDNLLSFGADYKRSDRHGLLVRLIDTALLIVAAWLLVFFPAHKPAESRTLIDAIEHARQVVIAALGATTLLVVALTWGGLDVACLTGAALYLTWRIGFQRDRAFALLAALTLTSTLFCYLVLNLGPRNILAFIAFFEIVGHFQDKLVAKAKTYHDIREHFLNLRLSDQEGASDELPAWDKLLCRFFWIFHQPPLAEAPESKP